MIRALALACGMAAAACAPAGPETISPGLYGNVRLSEESGDLGGMELELIGSGPGAHVEFVFCEGWCNSSHKAPVELTDGGFKFYYTEQYSYADGSPARARVEVQAIRTADGIRVTVKPTDDSYEPFSSDLPRISERFGLEVAAAAEK